MRRLVFTALAAVLGLISAAPASVPTTSLNYEYIVVGSGAGGGPLACRLARAGHSVLLLEAGDDQGTNSNYSVPAYQGIVSQDPKLRWDMFVSHYPDLARAQQDPKFVYSTPDGGQYVGLNPPYGSTPKGILYPRAGSLGGCTAHSALIYIDPHASDWDHIASLTGDSSWNSLNMKQYLDRVYTWQPVNPTDPIILLKDLTLLDHIAAGAATVGSPIPAYNLVNGLLTVLLDSPNDPVPGRDSREGFFHIPLIQVGGARISVRDYILATAAHYPLTVRTNAFVTDVIFDHSKSPPQAVGVNFLDGAHLYSASPLSTGAAGTRNSALASKEVILAGGAFNTPQLLKLSGIGPAEELKSFGIPVVVDLPGVGTNMQDRYEVPVNVVHPDDFHVLDGCTFDQKPHDLCYQQWLNNPYVYGRRGAYASNGLAASMITRSATASNSDVDLITFGGPIDFTGYFPGWGDAAVADHKHFSWYTLKAHTRNRAGTVKLRSTNPLDTPDIAFNYFDTGTTEGGADQLDVAALVEAIRLSRTALANYYPFAAATGGSGFVEQNPGADVQSDEDLAAYVKRVAWGHHASCTVPIGADGDGMAALDSKFRVRGVQGLRVVDASVFPRIPGVFITAPIFIVAEKAADVILNG